MLAAALLVSIFIGSRHITDEKAVMVWGDMPRYLMDGAFLYDVLGSGAEWTFGGAVEYAQRYYAQYPALSIPHHPPLLPISLVPFYAIFGPSIFAGRLAVLAFFLVSVVLVYTLVTRVYDEEVAGWACLLFASSPTMAFYAQRVLSEIPTIAMVLVALNALVRFCDSGRFRDYLLFVVFAIGSLGARQLAIFVWPAYIAVLLTRGGRARLVRRDVVTATLVGALLVAPIAVATVLFSPFNIAVVQGVFSDGLSILSRAALLGPISQEQLRPVLGFVLAGALLMALLRRDNRIMLGVYWMASVLAGVLLITGPVEPGRYSILALPAYCVCAASLIRAARSPLGHRYLSVALAAAVIWQVSWGLSMRLENEGGYEEAARFVLGDARAQSAPTVLYSASIDTGAFVFFVRKHDPGRRLVVLRADKLLTTSLMGQLSVEDRIRSAGDIYPLLDRYGTRFIVIEDRPAGSIVLDWLRDELRGDRFIERRRLGEKRSSSYQRGASLIVYEYKNARLADPGAEIDVNLPLVGRQIHVPLSALRPPVSR